MMRKLLLLACVVPTIAAAAELRAGIAKAALDLCFTFEPAILEEIRAGVRDSVSEVVFHASHTHSGPTYSEAPEAAKHAVPRVIGAIEAASKAMVPARIGNGWGQAFLGFNRR